MIRRQFFLCYNGRHRFKNTAGDMRQRGFTIMEMAIVLLVIGFIIGAIAMGREMVRNAGNSRLAKDVEQVRSLTYAFYTRYNAYPGDWDDAFSLWGTSCAASAANCNGNGDGFVGAYTTWSSAESLNFYLHLNLAGLAAYKATGRDALSGYPNYTVGSDMPKFSGVNGSDFALVPSTRLGTGGQAAIAGEDPRRRLELYTSRGVVGGTHYFKLFAPYDAYLFDKKFDDAKGAKGLVRGWEQVAASCFVGDYNTYDTSIKTSCDGAGCASYTGCYLWFGVM